jgi:hypothetical protein
MRIGEKACFVTVGFGLCVLPEPLQVNDGMEGLVLRRVTWSGRDEIVRIGDLRARGRGSKQEENGGELEGGAHDR